jgi:beta-phosphoglucomutase
MDIKGCIFDLDGVIVDTAKYHFLAWRKLANDLGFDFSEKDNEQLKGVGRERSLEIILGWGGVKKTPQQMVELAAKKNDWYINYVNNLQPDEILPGVSQFLIELRGIGIKIALGSASKNAKLILDKLNITNYFDAIIDGTNVSRAKPNPEVFLKGAKELGLDPNACIVFEDAKAGIEAAKSGGMYCVGIGEKENLKNADYWLNGFVDVTFNTLIKNLNSKE